MQIRGDFRAERRGQPQRTDFRRLPGREPHLNFHHAVVFNRNKASNRDVPKLALNFNHHAIGRLRDYSHLAAPRLPRRSVRPLRRQRHGLREKIMALRANLRRQSGRPDSHGAAPDAETPAGIRHGRPGRKDFFGVSHFRMPPRERFGGVLFHKLRFARQEGAVLRVIRGKFR